MTYKNGFSGDGFLELSGKPDENGMYTVYLDECDEKYVKMSRTDALSFVAMQTMETVQGYSFLNDPEGLRITAAVVQILRLGDIVFNQEEAMKAVELLTTKQIADRLSCDRRQVYKYQDTGLLKMSRYGRGFVATKEEVERFIQETEGAELQSEADMISYAQMLRRHESGRRLLS